MKYRVENIVRKGEISCYKQLLLFSQCFLQLHILCGKTEVQSDGAILTAVVSSCILAVSPLTTNRLLGMSLIWANGGDNEYLETKQIYSSSPIYQKWLLLKGYHLAGGTMVDRAPVSFLIQVISVPTVPIE